jgi:hypothetical protein
MHSKNMAHALLQLFECAFDKDFWESESPIIEEFANHNNGEQLDCEMISTTISEDINDKNTELSVVLGGKQYRVRIQVFDVETGERLSDEE